MLLTEGVIFKNLRMLLQLDHAYQKLKTHS